MSKTNGASFESRHKTESELTDVRSKSNANTLMLKLMLRIDKLSLKPLKRKDAN